MFKKVLVAEDIDALSLKDFLQELGVVSVDSVQYCDEAYLKFKKAALAGEPYELLICDLSFKPDHREEKIRSGEELATIVHKEWPATHIIMHSVEDNVNTIKKLLKFTDAYVCKGRKGLKYLETAIHKVYNSETYISPDVEVILKDSPGTELDYYELCLLKYLSQGFTQDEISDKFRDQGLKPFSKSSIEKRLKDLREEFGANTNPQLIGMVIGLQLI